MRTFRQHIVVVLAATIAATLGGVATGFLLARTLVMRVAEARLVDQATRSLAAADAYAADARKALAAMNASPYPYCSDSELTYFRRILFTSRYLREGGRMAGGRIECSTTLGRNELPQDRFKPIYSGEDGVRMYWDPAPFRVGSQATSILQVGTSYVDLATDIGNGELPPGATLKVTPRVAYAGPGKPAIAGDSTTPAEDGYRRVGRMLSATHCSTHYPD